MAQIIRDTAALLRNVTPKLGQTARAESGVYAGDGGGGLYVGTLNSSYTDDGATYIKPQETDTIWWVRVTSSGGPVGAQTVVGNPTITGRLKLNTAAGNVCISGTSGEDITTSVGFTGVGESAGRNVTTGDNTTAVGANALSSLTTGEGNTACGRGALASIVTATANTAVGKNAATAATASGLTAVGYASLQSNIDGASNTAVGYNAGRYLTSGDPMVSLANCSFIGNDSRCSASNQVQLGNASTTTYAYGAVQDRSDARDKADVRDTTLGLDFVTRLRPVDFRWDRREQYQDIDADGNITHAPRDGSRARKRYHHGLIAQEVKRVCDELGVDFGGYQDHSIGGGEDVLSIGYAELIAPLIRAVQELSAKIDKLGKKR